MEILQEYASPMIMAFCFGIGYCIKKFTPESFDNKYIPSIVSIIGIFFSIWCNGFTVTPPVVLCGLASGLASTGIDQLIKTLKKGDN